MTLKSRFSPHLSHWSKTGYFCEWYKTGFSVMVLYMICLLLSSCYIIINIFIDLDFKPMECLCVPPSLTPRWEPGVGLCCLSISCLGSAADSNAGILVHSSNVERQDSLARECIELKVKNQEQLKSKLKGTCKHSGTLTHRISLQFKCFLFLAVLHVRVLNFLTKRLNPWPLHWEQVILTTGPPQSPQF